MKYGIHGGGGGASGRYVMELDVDISICPSIWNKFHGPAAPRFSVHFLFQTSFSENIIHFHQSPYCSGQNAFVILSIAASTFVLLPFFCCCLEGPCCSGPAVAIASSCSCSIGVVLLLGVDPWC